MNKLLFFFIISILTITGCSVPENTKKTVMAGQLTNEADLLDFYRQYSAYTDPGEYEYLYENLPDSLGELCSLIRAQYINYVAELDMYRELIPEERWNESAEYLTVKSALGGFYPMTLPV